MTRTGSRQRPQGNARSGASLPATPLIVAKRSAPLGQARLETAAVLSPHVAARVSAAGQSVRARCCFRDPRGSVR